MHSVFLRLKQPRRWMVGTTARKLFPLTLLALVAGSMVGAASFSLIETLQNASAPFAALIVATVTYVVTRKFKIFGEFGRA